MTQAGLLSFIILALLIPPLLILQRWLQREIQSIFLLLTRQPPISVALFSLLFLPGVLLHEVSHFLMAHLLGVKTGRFSIIPRKMEGGRLQLGFVETASTDFVRDALIGAAPLIAGGIFVAYAGASRLGLNTLWESLAQGEMSSLRSNLAIIFDRPDFWLWFYLIFAVSSTMMPSPSDRRAWLPLLLVLGSMAILILLLGVGPWLMEKLGVVLSNAWHAVTVIFGISVLIHAVLLPPVWFLRKIFSRILGYQVV